MLITKKQFKGSGTTLTPLGTGAYQIDDSGGVLSTAVIAVLDALGELVDVSVYERSTEDYAFTYNFADSSLTWSRFPDWVRGRGFLFECGAYEIASYDAPEAKSRDLYLPGDFTDTDSRPVVVYFSPDELGDFVRLFEMEVEKNRPWKPKVGDDCYTLDRNRVVVWDNDPHMVTLWKAGLIVPTKEAAARAVDLLLKFRERGFSS